MFTSSQGTTWGDPPPMISVLLEIILKRYKTERLLARWIEERELSSNPMCKKMLGLVQEGRRVA
jgi:hypothetical protein